MSEKPINLGIVGKREHEILSQTTRDVLEEYVCSLYGFKNEKDINVVRYKIFTNGKKLPDPQRLPPTSDALQLHFRRSDYQVYEWKNALNCDFEPLDPNGNGWYIADGMIKIKWQTQLPAQEAILQFVSCECKKSKCANNMCRCRVVNLCCTKVCNCDECLNHDLAEDSDSETDNKSSEYTDDSESGEDI